MYSLLVPTTWRTSSKPVQLFVRVHMHIWLGVGRSGFARQQLSAIESHSTLLHFDVFRRACLHAKAKSFHHDKRPDSGKDAYARGSAIWTLARRCKGATSRSTFPNLIETAFGKHLQSSSQTSSPSRCRPELLWTP